MILELVSAKVAINALLAHLCIGLVASTVTQTKRKIHVNYKRFRAATILLCKGLNKVNSMIHLLSIGSLNRLIDLLVLNPFV